MSDQDKLTLIYQSLSNFPASLDLDQVAEALGISRKTVDRLIAAQKIEYFEIEVTEEQERPAKRVMKATLIDYMISRHISGPSAAQPSAQ